jgi:hypothetical protein
MKIALYISTLLFPTVSFAQIFGAGNYEDCVLRGIKDAKTDGAVTALIDACAKKFPKNVTWNGDRFLPGAPVDKSKFTGIRFKQTVDLIFMPEHMDRKLMRKVIEQRITEIRKICPGILLD